MVNNNISCNCESECEKQQKDTELIEQIVIDIRSIMEQKRSFWITHDADNLFVLKEKEKNKNRCKGHIKQKF